MTDDFEFTARATVPRAGEVGGAGSPGSPSPGWYPDPYDPVRSQRWWDGQDWTDFESPVTTEVRPWPVSTTPAQPLPDFWKRLLSGRLDRASGTNAAASMALAVTILGVVTAIIPHLSASLLSMCCLIGGVVWGIMGLVRASRGVPGVVPSALAIAISALLLLFELVGFMFLWTFVGGS